MAQDRTPDLTREAAAATTLPDLGLLLRKLLRREARQRGDTPWTYRELAAKTGWSLGSISRYFDAKVVPPTDRFDALVRLLGANAAEQGALATARDTIAESHRQPTPSTWPVPRQLPRDTTGFTGRGVELEGLLTVSDPPLGSAGAAVVISAIDGMAGIGKTALAVHAAHRLAARYPDGQLFLDLHGFTVGVAPVEPANALDRLLRDVGVLGERIPAGLEERAAMWRSLLAGRRMLIVLDNAATETQVRPLLPGAAGCLVLVTSRRRLAALEATHVLSLDTLPEADAVLLLVRTADRPDLRIDTPESAELREVVEMCGRLPLAIRIAASRLKHRRVWTVADLVGRLRGLDARLTAFDDGQRNVHATLHLSYQYLSTDAQRLYRLLGLHPGVDVDPFAVAALTATSLNAARRTLDGLVDDHLLQEQNPGRYRFHDLVRVHAADTATRQETPAQRRDAWQRLLDHYRHTAAAAMDVAHPYERQRRPTVHPSGTPTPDLTDRSRADRWLDAELANLLAAAQHAAKIGRPEYTWQLSAILDRHLRTRGHYRDAQTLHQHVLDLARRAGNRSAEMHALNGLGDVHWRLGHYEQAVDHLGQALQIAQDIRDRGGHLRVLNGLGSVHRLLGHYEQAAGYYQGALQIAQEIGDLGGKRQALTGLGSLHWRQGRYEQAAVHYRRALRTARDSGDRGGELDALTGLGDVRRGLGRYAQAASHYQRALQIAHEIGDRGGQLQTLTALGNVHKMLGHYEQAADHYGSALQVVQATGNRSGELTTLNGLGDVHRMLGRYSEAARCYQHVFDLARELGSGNWQFEALQGLGRLQHAIGRPELALSYHQQALKHATDLVQAQDQARAHDGLAHAHHALNQNDRARWHWQNALDIFTSLRIEQSEDIEASVPLIRAHLIDLGPEDP